MVEKTISMQPQGYNITRHSDKTIFGYSKDKKEKLVKESHIKLMIAFTKQLPTLSILNKMQKVEKAKNPGL